MRKVQLLVDASQLGAVRSILAELGIEGMTVAETVGFGVTDTRNEVYHGVSYAVGFTPAAQIEVVVPEALIQPVIDALTVQADAGYLAWGQVFVSPITEAIRIRTGEHGDDAI